MATDLASRLIQWYVQQSYEHQSPKLSRLAESTELSESLIEKVGRGRQRATRRTLRAMSPSLAIQSGLLLHDSRILAVLEAGRFTHGADLIVSPWSNIIVAGNDLEDLFGLGFSEIAGKNLEHLFETPPTLVNSIDIQSVVAWKLPDGHAVVLGQAVVTPVDDDWYVTILYNEGMEEPWYEEPD